jgi:hypothetical protein
MSLPLKHKNGLCCVPQEVTRGGAHGPFNCKAFPPLRKSSDSSASVGGLELTLKSTSWQPQALTLTNFPLSAGAFTNHATMPPALKESHICCVCGPQLAMSLAQREVGRTTRISLAA